MKNRLTGLARESDPTNIAFGFGRRVCPGQAFAEDSIWLLAARVLALFSISWQGEAPPQDYKDMFSSGALSYVLVSNPYS